jgi:NAD(P)-dependent dehydrogenase (short-subunit alcohol dehydrogenase family)
LLPRLRDGGRIINVSSMAARVAYPRAYRVLADVTLLEANLVFTRAERRWVHWGGK